jgi:hypothetical protein
MQLLRRQVRERHAHGAERGVEEAHVGVVELFRVGLAGLELEGAVVVCQPAGQADEHLSEGRVDIEVELAFEVVRAELAEVGFVPGDNWGEPDLPHAREEGERSEDEGRDEEFVVVERLEEGVGLAQEVLDAACQL